MKFDIDLPEFRKKFTASENPAAVNYAATVKAAEGALSRAITKLGEAGWEMIGQGVFTFNNERNAGWWGKSVLVGRGSFGVRFRGCVTEIQTLFATRHLDRKLLFVVTAHPASL